MHETKTQPYDSLSRSPEKGTEATCSTRAEGNQSEAQRTLQIKTLNDTFRATFMGGQVVLTQEVSALKPVDEYEVIRRVQTYSSFTQDNDPHGEHDFGNFRYKEQIYFWKIDYFDKQLTGGSEDPADPHVTTRVLTIMLAHEY